MSNKITRVVVTGMGVMSPLGESVSEYWKNLLEGHSGIGPITLADASPFQCKIAGEVKIGEASARALFGNGIAGLFTVAVMLSMFGSLNGNILVGPRVTYAMAKDDLFFRQAADVHPKYRTPGNAIILQGIWAGILTLTGTFKELITLVGFVNFMLWIASASTVFVLRKKQPDLERPYKVWGYPYVPAFFIIF